MSKVSRKYTEEFKNTLLVMDLHTRKIVGYYFGISMITNLIIELCITPIHRKRPIRA